MASIDAITLGLHMFKNLHDPRFELALQMLDHCAQITSQHFQNLKQVDLKKNGTEVTEVDLAIEKYMRDCIHKHFPNDNTIGEEFKNKDSDFHTPTWTIDPIDGTRAFALGVPLFGTMIGFVDDNKIQFGVIDFPALNERILAYIGLGTYWKPAFSTNYKKVSVSTTAHLSQSLFCHSGREYFDQNNKLDLYQKLIDQCAKTRVWGDCYGYALVATGRADLMMDPILHIWDIVPAKIIIEQAGGVFTDLDQSNEFQLKSGLACNADLFNEINHFL